MFAPTRFASHRVVPVLLLALATLLVVAGQARAATAEATVALSGPSVAPGGGGGFGIYNFAITPAGSGAHPFGGGVKRGHCVEVKVQGGAGEATLRSEGDVALNPAASAAQPGRVAWLVLSSLHAQDAPAGPLSEDQLADAHQSAIWKYTDPTETRRGTSSDPDVAAKADELAGEAEKHKDAAQREAALVATGEEICGGGTRGVMVSGAPFSTAVLNAAGGTFPDGATSIELELGEDGTATTEVSAGVGTVTVTGTITEATLVHVDFKNKQDLVYTEKKDVDVELTIDFPACETPQTPTQPTTTTTPEAQLIPVSTPAVRASPRRAIPARLRIVKRGPRQARAGKRIRYVITVRNTSRVRARRVVIQDRLPAGMVLAKRTRGMTVRGRTIIMRVGSLGPRRTIRRVVTVRVLNGTGGRRCNRAIANAANARLVRTRVCTRIRRIAPRVLPAVTG